MKLRRESAENGDFSGFKSYRVHSGPKIDF
jgi:hypothetical protein